MYLQPAPRGSSFATLFLFVSSVLASASSAEVPYLSSFRLFLVCLPFLASILSAYCLFQHCFISWGHKHNLESFLHLSWQKMHNKYLLNWLESHLSPPGILLWCASNPVQKLWFFLIFREHSRHWLSLPRLFVCFPVKIQGHPESSQA